MKLFLVVSIMLGLNAAVAGEGPTPGKPAPDFTGVLTTGETVTLSDLRGKPVMLEWTNHDCPYVRKHYSSGNMQQTQRALTEAGVIWISVISSAPGKQGHVTAAEADQLSESRGTYNDMLVLDPSGEIGRLYDAKTTPQMFLIDTEGTLQYMGAIDDRPSTRASSLEGASNYALQAWQQLAAGEAVTPNSTQPYGCSVKYGK
ncbi:redoxin domain-containing protein [Kordiimonas lacus]|uniref:Peroxiredoxin n=1 Tax=Kordiimonas lacus TaxID=637679 RepID=A0A1G6WRZ5_9PROT|nr:redoxin domain-containing protein [Kordiimonas lacus]SDD67856.1 Peroxiredoxin [Kordiimonas lacus]